MISIYRNIYLAFMVFSLWVGQGLYAQETQINISADLAFVPNSGQWDDFIGQCYGRGEGNQ